MKDPKLTSWENLRNEHPDFYDEEEFDDEDIDEGYIFDE